MRPFQIIRHQHEHGHHHHHHEGCDHEHEHHHHHPEQPNDGKAIPEAFGGQPAQLTFENLLTFFPEVELPINIGSETQRRLHEIQEPLNGAWAAKFLLDEDEEIDEYTEFMACFKLPNTLTFHALVYWEANLYGNGYYLATFDKAGRGIDKLELAGTKYSDEGLIQTVCTISPNWLITQIEGRIDAATQRIVKLDKRDQYHWQLTTEGDFIEM